MNSSFVDPSWELSDLGLDSESQNILAAALASTALPNQILNDKRKNDENEMLYPVKISHLENENIKQQPTPPENGEQESLPNGQRKPGRKPIVNSEVEPHDKSSKRKAQNRAAQRAFRERKEKYVKELETRISELENAEKKTSRLEEENKRLRAILEQLQAENLALKAEFTFEFPLPDPNLLKPISDLALPSPPSSKEIINESSPETETPGSLSSSNLHFDPNTPETLFTSPEYEASNQFSDSNLSPSQYTPKSASLGKAPNQHSVTYDSSTVLFGAYRDAPIFPNDSLLSNNDEFPQLFDISDFGGFPVPAPASSDAEKPAETTPPDKEQLSGPAAWKIITEHPKFEEFDLDALCDEFKKKAKCSKALVDRDILDNIIKKLEENTG
ncbi:uncharacterized protein VTP21DRAFT_5457 [Calcarisporiella thermophila]|uniref:uncharacterized protein n=1 Tax=Calcarisporiella thermophila TaxID=911321 RepID=UPI0037425265